MDAKLIAETEDLRRTAERLERVGLIVDRTTLSPSLRRALFALQCRIVEEHPLEAKASSDKIGFAYPNAR